MNVFTGVGRLVADPTVRFTGEQLMVASFNLAIDRIGKDKGADFIKVSVFGKQAENCEKYISKGSLVGVEGEIRTGSYEKDGKKVYTTEVIASRVEFLSPKSESTAKPQSNIPDGFEYAKVTDEELPF